MELYIGDAGEITSTMEKDSINFRMQLYIKDNGRIMCLMEQVFILIVMGKNGRVSLEMENLIADFKNSLLYKSI